MQAFCKNNQVTSVLLKTDNTTVVAYVNKIGGTRSLILVQPAKELWGWCLQRKIHLKAQHLPEKLNFNADFLSRHLRDQSDWILDQEIFNMIDAKLDIDLFATRPYGRGNRRFCPRLDSGQGLCSPTMVSHLEGPQQGSDPDSNVGRCSSLVANTSLVSSAHEYAHLRANLTPSRQMMIAEPSPN